MSEFVSLLTVKTARLELQLLEESHLNDLHAIWSNPSVAKWSTRGTSHSREDSKARMDRLFFDSEKPEYLSYGVSSRVSDSKTTAHKTIIGIIGVTSLPSLDTVEIGYLFNQSFWGHGYASEALAAYIEAYWGHAKSTNFMVAKVDPLNMSSIRVLEKCGFRVVERLVGDVVLPELGRRDTIIMRLVRPASECSKGVPASL